MTELSWLLILGDVNLKSMVVQAPVLESKNLIDERKITSYHNYLLISSFFTMYVVKMRKMNNKNIIK